MPERPESAAAMKRVRRGRFDVLRWLLAHTQTGRAVLWNEWLNGQKFEREQARVNAELDAEEFEGGYPWPNL